MQYCTVICSVKFVILTCILQNCFASNRIASCCIVLYCIKLINKFIIKFIIKLILTYHGIEEHLKHGPWAQSSADDISHSLQYSTIIVTLTIRV